MALPTPEEIDAMMAADSQSGMPSASMEGLPSPDEINAMMQQEAYPQTTGSGFGDAVDAVGGFGSNALRDLYQTALKPADWLYSLGTSGLEAAGLDMPNNLFGVQDPNPTKLIGAAFDTAYGDTGQKSEVGREFSRAGQLTGTGAGLLTGLGALKGLPYLGKAATFLSTNPLAQLEASATGGLLGQAAAEQGLVERGGLGQTLTELGGMVGPDALGGAYKLGKAGANSLRKLFYTTAPEEANRAIGAIEKISGAPLAEDFGQNSAQLGRSMQIAENVGGREGIKRTTGEMVGEADQAVTDASSEVGQLMAEKGDLLAQRTLTGSTPYIKDRLTEIDNILASVPKVDTKVVSEGFPLVNSKYGDFFKGTEKVVTESPNKAYQALKELENVNKEAHKVYSDLTSVFKVGKRGGKTFSPKDYEKSSEKIGNALLSGKGVTAKDFVRVASENSPETLALGRQMALGEVFKGDPKDWLKQLNEKRSAIVSLLDKEAVNPAMKVLDDIATSNSDLVGGHITSYIAGIINKKLVLTGLSAIAATGPHAALTIPLMIASAKAANTIAKKPAEITTLVSRALVSPEARKLLALKANPENIKTAIEYFKNVGRNAIMGTADEKITPSDKTEAEIVAETIAAPDRDLTPKAIKADVISQIDSDPVDSAIFAMESNRGKNLDNPESTAQGFFQLINSTARKLGVKDVNDPQQNYEGYLKLKEEATNAGADTPEDYYAYHYLGGPVYRKWKKGRALDSKEQAQVDNLEYTLLPRFKRIYNNNKHYKGELTKI